MVGALGTALAEQKLAIAYGGEAGGMDEGLEDLVRRYCQGGLMITRNVESGEVLGKLGIKTRIGTDTAWTFEPGPRDKARAALERAGWDGKTPILAVTPINPFWWPVKPDLMKGAAHAIAGMHGDAHYDSFYFHNDGNGVRRAQAKYIASLADGMKRYLAEKKAFPILVGMEQLDRRACEALRDELGFDVPLFVSDEYEMYEMVSILRECSMLVSSRYHAIVTSMPGLVASAGVTMDERIRNLMGDRSQPELCLRVDEEDLGDKVYETIRLLDREQERIRDGIGECVVTNLGRMGEMGGMLADYVREKHPEFPLRAEFGTHGDAWAHLPPMSKELHALITKYGEGRAS
jgi:polysaccharide pyruvyl transferase WcaK-like protein